MTKKSLSRLFSFLVVLCLVLGAAPQDASAASVSISASATTITVGETVTITVTVSGTNIAGMTCSVSNAGTASNSTSSFGASSLSDTVRFTPSSAGTYSITATCTEAYAWTDENLSDMTNISGGTSNTITITVKAATTPTPTATPTPTPTPTKTPTPTPTKTPTPSPSKTPTPSPSATATPSQSQTPSPSPSPTPLAFIDLTDASGKSYRVQTAFPEGLTIPEGLEDGIIRLQEQDVQMVKTADGALCMVCVTDNQDKNPQLMVLDTVTGKLADTASHSVTGAYTVYPIDSALTAPQGFEDCALEFGGKSVRAWSDLAREGFCMVYACNAEGAFGYYIYDEQEGTFQRFVQSGDVVLPTPTPTPSPTSAPVVPEEEKEPAALGTWRTIAICAIVTCILALGALSVTIFLQHNPKHLLKDAQQDVQEDPFPDEAFENEYSYDETEE